MQFQPVPAPVPIAVPLQNPVIVLGPQFVAPYPVELVITKKLMTFKEGQFTVTDANGNVMFTVKGSVFSVYDQRVLVDSIGNPILTLRQKILSAHRRWQVYRGGSSDRSNFMFTVRKSSIFQLKTRLDVFLAANPAEDFPDFHIEGNFFGSGCKIYQGNTSVIIAQMHRRHSIKSILLDKDTYGVTVSPHVDYAFVTAIIVILHEINADKNGSD